MRWHVLWLLLLFTLMISAGHAQRHFITAFLENYRPNVQADLQLYLVSHDQPASVTVTMPLSSYNETVLLDRNSSTRLYFGSEFMLFGQQIESKVVTVNSDANISVFAFNIKQETTDALACFSDKELGTEYYIFTTGAGSANQFAVANGREEEVQVAITMSGSLAFNGVEYNSKQTFDFTLGSLQVIQFQSSSDLTGTRVSSSTPVAVFSGNQCFTGKIGACDFVVEQLVPVNNWGTNFVIFPLITDESSQIIDIISSRPNTLVDVVNNGGTTQYHLDQGSHISLDVTSGLLVNASEPIMISYLFQGGRNSLVNSFDPFLTTVPPNSFFRRYYKFVTHESYYNYILIVSQSSSPTDFYLDHQPLSQYTWSSQSFEGFYGWKVELGKMNMEHEISHSSLAFGLYVYGIEIEISYGYSLGQESTFQDPPLPDGTEEPEALSQLTCLSHGAKYQLPLSLVTNANISINDVHLHDPKCEAHQEGDWAVISVPYDKCGSRILIEDGKTFYVNTVYGTVPGTPIHRIEVPLKCEMVANETLSMHFNPTVTDVVALGHHNISLKFYHSEDFMDPVTTFPYEVGMHGRLYVEFKVDSDDEGLQILTENCKSSPSLEPGDMTYSIIKHGCFQDSTLHTYPAGDQREEHFGFQIFKFEDFPEVYLFCDVIICHDDSVPNRCTQGCIGERQKRDLSGSNSQFQAARLSQGPIVFKNGREVQRPAYQEFSQSPAHLSLVGILCAVALLAGVGLLLQRIYYRRKNLGYALLPDRGE
uniref:IgGFc-binding protein-like n=1 Tax=Geotrypetes seraphini TaxID=260995 RepID=A0A6P8Q608_GEOSA|nr:IgGFc-binding protein-like [Geotrypetes seraphini]